MGLCSSTSTNSGVAEPLEPAQQDPEVEGSAVGSTTAEVKKSLVDLGVDASLVSEFSHTEKKHLQAVLAPLYDNSSVERDGISPKHIANLLVLDGENIPEGSSYHAARVPLFAERLHNALIKSQKNGDQAALDNTVNTNTKPLHISSLVRGLKDISNTHSSTEQQAGWLYKSVYSDENAEELSGRSNKSLQVKDLTAMAVSFLNATATASISGVQSLRTFESDIKRLGLDLYSSGGLTDHLVEEAVLEYICESTGNLKKKGTVTFDENSKVSKEAFQQWVESLKA